MTDASKEVPTNKKRRRSEAAEELEKINDKVDLVRRNTAFSENELSGVIAKIDKNLKL